jgi:hypothetical protein
MTLYIAMHGPMNVKFVNAKQAKETYRYGEVAASFWIYYRELYLFIPFFKYVSYFLTGFIYFSCSRINIFVDFIFI